MSDAETIRTLITDSGEGWTLSELCGELGWGRGRVSAALHACGAPDSGVICAVMVRP